MSDAKIRLVWYVERLRAFHWLSLARGGQMPNYDTIMEMSDREASAWLELIACYAIEQAICREGVI